MNFWSMFEKKPAEHKVGVPDGFEFQHEICSTKPADRIDLIKNMKGVGKDASVAFDKDGNIKFDGQFIIGSVGGTASDNTFNLNTYNPKEKFSIIDSHNNRINISCRDNSPADSSQPTAADNSTSHSTMSDEQLNALLREAGIDPKTYQRLNRTDETSAPSAPTDAPGASTYSVLETKSDIELPNHTHIIFAQVGDRPPTVTLPAGLTTQTDKDGGLEIKLEHGTIRFANGGISETGDLGDVRTNTTTRLVSDKR